MRMKQAMKMLAGGAGACALWLALPASGQSGQAQLSALSQIQPGLWELHSRGGSLPDRSICVSDPAILLQLRHGNASCSRFVITNDARSVTVHYSCPSAGHGQTTLRVETPRLAQIDSQGVADHAPFAFTTEARRVGNCQSSDRIGLR
jgi:hypothetical protein